MLLLLACALGPDDSTSVIVAAGCVAVGRWAPDADGDGFGSSDAVVLTCEAPGGYVPDESDCDDASATVHPGPVDLCGDGIDANCDGADSVAWARRRTWDVGEATLRVSGAEVPSAGLGTALAARSVDDERILYVSEPGSSVVYRLDPDLGGDVEIARLDRFAAGDPDTWFGYSLATGALGGGPDDDLAVGVPGSDGFRGAVHLFLDADDDAVVLVDEDGLGFGAVVAGRAVVLGSTGASAGDVLLVNTTHGAEDEARGGAWRLQGPFEADVPAVEIGTAWLSDEPGDGAGTALAVVDAEGDGVDDALVGAPHGLVDGVRTGVAWLVGEPGPLQSGLRLRGAVGGDAWFGYAVANLGDFTGDGHDDVVVGAPFDWVGESEDAGRAWVWAGPFDRDRDAEDAQLVVSGSEPLRGVGFDVGSLGDVTLDGAPDLAVTAGYGGDDFAGVVYGFTCGLAGTATEDDADLRLEGDGTFSFFGGALLPFVAHEGIPALAVGASGDSTGVIGGELFTYLLAP